MEFLLCSKSARPRVKWTVESNSSCLLVSMKNLHGQEASSTVILMCEHFEVVSRTSFKPWQHLKERYAPYICTFSMTFEISTYRHFTYKKRTAWNRFRSQNDFAQTFPTICLLVGSKEAYVHKKYIAHTLPCFSPVDIILVCSHYKRRSYDIKTFSQLIYNKKIKTKMVPQPFQGSLVF